MIAEGQEKMYREAEKEVEGRCSQREKIESQTASPGELAFYLAAMECKATNILTSPLETAAFPFFKDIFSLFIGSLRRDPSPGPDTGFLL